MPGPANPGTFVVTAVRAIKLLRKSRMVKDDPYLKVRLKKADDSWTTDELRSGSENRTEDPEWEAHEGEGAVLRFEYPGGSDAAVTLHAEVFDKELVIDDYMCELNEDLDVMKAFAEANLGKDVLFEGLPLQKVNKKHPDKEAKPSGHLTLKVRFEATKGNVTYGDQPSIQEVLNNYGDGDAEAKA